MDPLKEVRDEVRAAVLDALKDAAHSVAAGLPTTSELLDGATGHTFAVTVPPVHIEMELDIQLDGQLVIAINRRTPVSPITVLKPAG